VLAILVYRIRKAHGATNYQHIAKYYRLAEKAKTDYGWLGENQMKRGLKHTQS
jgi:hypothetical protein